MIDVYRCYLPNTWLGVHGESNTKNTNTNSIIFLKHIIGWALSFQMWDEISTQRLIRHVINTPVGVILDKALISPRLLIII